MTAIRSVCAAASILWCWCLTPLPGFSQVGIGPGVGTGDITFHSTYWVDILISPSSTTGTTSIPQSPGELSHEVFAPGGSEHALMRMSWDNTSTQANAFIPLSITLTGATRLELVPSPPNPAHHAATITGTFSVDFTLDGSGLSTVFPARSYSLLSYVNPAPGSPSGAGFEAHWDYTDVGFGPLGGLGSQHISYTAPSGFGTLATLSSAPVTITVPPMHTTLRMSGYFTLSAESDDFLGGPPPFDTMIAIVPEPGTLLMACIGVVALWGYRRRMLGTRFVAH